MSDREMRRVLKDVMDDIESGRVKPRRRLTRLGALIGGGAMAASLALAGCDTAAQPAYGVPPDSTVVQYDGDVDASDVDAGPVIEYGGPDIDAGLDAGVDAEVLADSAVDSGPVVDYGGPDIDAGGMPEYGSP